MRRMVRMATLTLALVLGFFFIAENAKAACTTVGSPVGSSDLTCTHVPGANQNAFRSWIEQSWAPAAIEDYFRTLIAYDPTRDWSTSLLKTGYAYEKWSALDVCCSSLVYRDLTYNPPYPIFHEVQKDNLSATFDDSRNFSSAYLVITVTNFVEGVIHYSYTMLRANWNVGEEEIFRSFGQPVSGVYSLAPVPGPVAGAGLPALAALAYMLRRRGRRGRTSV